MCEQMKHCPAINIDGKLAAVDVRMQDAQQLNSMFSVMVREARKAVKNGKGPFFFVIDGLQNLKQFEGDELKRLLPSGDPNGIYLLLSGTPGTKYHCEVAPWPPQPFSYVAIKTYFSDINLTETNIRDILKVSNGIPGYLSEFRRQLISGDESKDLLTKIPIGLNNLMENEWKRIQSKMTDFDLLALILFSPEPPNISSLLKITKLEKEQLLSKLREYRVIDIDEETGLLDLRIYRNFLLTKLDSYRTSTNQKLIKYFKDNNDESSSVHHLPILYKNCNDYESLEKLLRPENLVKHIIASRDISVVKRNIRILAEMSSQSQDWQRTALASIMDALITEIITVQPVLEDHVEALLALGNYESALEKVLNSALPEDLLRLLSPVCKYIQAKGLDIPESAKKALEDSVERIDTVIHLTPWIIDDLYNIAASLFAINSELALRLLKKVSEYKGESTESGNLIDMLCARLAVKLGPDNESTEQLRVKIENESLREFVLTAPNFLLGTDVTELFKQVNMINDLSAQLFILRAWCNENLNNEHLAEVVFKAIDMITTAENHTPSLIYLRQFSKYILSFTLKEDAEKATALIDRLKDTAIKNPIEEYSRVEITMAEIEAKFGIGNGENRLIQVYLDCLDLLELDVKCYILGRILIRIKDIIKSDLNLYNEVKEQLSSVYDELIKSSASHFDIAVRLLNMLTKHDHELALAFAERLNLQERRELAFKEIARVYTDKEIVDIDFSFLSRVIDKIDYVSLREWIFTQTLKKMVMKDEIPCKKVIYEYYKKLENISNYQASAYCCTYLMKWLSDDQIQIDVLYGKLLFSLENISPKWTSIKLGYDAVKILAEINRNLAEKLFLKLSTGSFVGSFTEQRVSESFIRTVRLAIRVLKDMVNAPSFNRGLETIEEAISQIPSILDQCSLICAAAHICLSSNHIEEFRELMKKCCSMLESCHDNDIFNELLLVSAPMIFEHEREILFDKISLLTQPTKDSALMNVLDYIITKTAHDEPLDRRSLKGTIDLVDVRKFLDVVSYIETDEILYEAIELLVNSITQSEGTFKSRTTLQEKQTLESAEKIKTLIDQKLPDKRNIQHNGYQIVCYGQLARLRQAATARRGGFRANVRWENVCPTWDLIKTMADDVPNVSDRVFVYSVLSETAAHVDLGWCQKFASLAESLLKDVSNHIDRAQHYYAVAMAYSKASNTQVAEYLLKTAAELAQSISSEKGRDSLLGVIIEQAYTIDASLASSIAGKVDDPKGIMQLTNEVTCMSLRTDPARIEHLLRKCESNRRIIPDSIRKIYSSFMSGRTMAQQKATPGKWIQQSLGYDPETINMCIAWYVENSFKLRTRPTAKPEFEDLFMGLIKTLEATLQVGNFLGTIGATKTYQPSFYQAIDKDLLIVPVGQGERAIGFIRGWLTVNVKTYVKIYEPYFEIRFLSLLTAFKSDARVTIITARKTSEIYNVESEFRTFWKSICDQDPPSTTIYIFHNPSGKTLIHDRYIVTDKAGLNMGTSLGGYGNKDSTIKTLEFDNKSTIEGDLINSLIISPPSTYNDAKLELLVFTL